MQEFNTKTQKSQSNFTQNIDEIIRQLATDHGFSNLPLYFKLDGKRHRFGTKVERTPYWYIGEYLENGHFKVSFGSHKSIGMIPFTYFSNHIEKTKKISDMDFLERFEASSPYGSSVYLQEKKLGSNLYGARISSLKSLVIPMYFDNSLVGVHTIWRSNPGEKYNKATCGKAKGAYFELLHPEVKIKDTIFICEGFSTAASILLAIETRTVCSFGAENLKSVAKYFSEKNPGVRILIAADNDDVGLMAAFNSGFSFVAPNLEGKDWNDIHMEFGLEEVKRQISDSLFKTMKQPISLESHNAEGALPSNYPPILSVEDNEEFIIENEKEIDEANIEEKEEVLFDLKRGELGLIAGLAKDGKSGLATSLAVQLATGSKNAFLGLNGLKEGNVCIVSMIHDASYYETFLDSFKPILSCEENEKLKKSLSILDFTDHSQKMSSELIIDKLFDLKNNDQFLDNLKLIIIDDITKWDETNLNDSVSISKMIDHFKKLAFKLDAAILFLLPTVKNVFFVGKTNKPNISSCFGSYAKLASYIPWMLVISDAKGNDLKHFNNDTKNDPRMLMLLGSKRSDIFIPLSRRKDLCNLLIKHGLRLDTKENDHEEEDKPVDVTIVGADIKNGAIAMPSDLLKTKGIFGSFAKWQNRPKLYAEIRSENCTVKMAGHTMFNGADLRLLSVITEKAAKNGNRILLKNLAKRYEDIASISNDVSLPKDQNIPTFMFQTTFYEIAKSLGIESPGKNHYASISNSLEILGGCKIYFDSKKEMYNLDFLNYHIDKDTNKITLSICPYLTNSLLGLSHYALIDTEAARLINSDLSYILYQAICARLSHGETLDFKTITLLEYIFPSETTSENIKDRKKALKLAINNLQNDFKGLIFKSLDQDKWQVTRTEIQKTLN